MRLAPPRRTGLGRAVLFGSACAAALLFAHPLRAQALEPWRMMRSLQLLQDRIADGDQAALPMQRRLLAMTDGRLRALSVAELADVRNFDAVMVYAMSGGNPATVQALMPDLLAAAEKLDAPPPVPGEEEEADGEAESGHEAADPTADGHGPAKEQESTPTHGKAAAQPEPEHAGTAEEAHGPEHGNAAPTHEAPPEASAHGEEHPAAETPQQAGRSADAHGDAAPAPKHDGHGDAEEGNGHADTPAEPPEHDALTTGSTAPAVGGGHGGSSGGHGNKAAEGHDEAGAAPALPGQKRRLALGVYNYGRGRLPDAKAALGPLDPLRERAEVGSHLALVKGSLLANEDPRAALKLLDTARLLGIGTLVEEAALRRSVALTVVLGDDRRFLLASGQYVRRFLRSPYASQFADAFVAGIVGRHETLDLGAVADVTAGMTAEQERVVYLRVARRAAIENLAALSLFASAKAGAHPSGGAGSDPRAALYAALTGIAARDTAETLKHLEGIDPAGLSAGDRALLDAAKAVAGETLALPPPLPAAPPPVRAASPSRPEPVPASAVPEDVPAEASAEGEEELESVEDPASAEAPAPQASAPERPVPEMPAPDAAVVAEPATAADAPETVEPAFPPNDADAKMLEARRALDAVDKLLKDVPE